MKKSIFCKLLYICFISLVIAGAVSAFIFQGTIEKSKTEEYTQLLKTATMATDSLDANYMSGLTGGHRITVIDLAGNVLSDSQVKQPLENHRLRPEVYSAIEGKVGISQRTSATLGTDMLYIAVNDGDMIYRISIPISGVDRSFLQLLPAIIIGIIIASIVAVVLAGGISNSLISPLSNINENIQYIKNKEYDKVSFSMSKYDEINEMTATIERLLGELTGHIEDMDMYNDKMEFILNNMSQGMILLDEDTNIILYNRYAGMLFKVHDLGAGVPLTSLTGDNKINERVQQCIESGISRMFDMEINGGTYAVVIKPVKTSWQPKGAFVMLTDVTEVRSRQKLRQQFVDGVVHDLRNPIASIGENAATLCKDIEKGTPVQKEYLDEIVEETEHMQEVIDDLLILSVLDESKEEAKRPAIHAYDICTSVQEKLIPMSKEKNLSIQIDGNKDTLIHMKPEHFEKVMTELMTNAIKYNENNGKVQVTMEQKGDRAKISIFNTGPGIDPILIPRLFERFYREEQNRNAQIQGAGLGLAIIKHILTLYDGNISVKYQPDSGITFKITI